MSQFVESNGQQPPSDEIDLFELFRVVWKNKLTIMLTVVLVSIATSIYVLQLPNIYRSEVLLVPAQSQTSGSVPSQLGGLAALAGVNLGAKDDKSMLAIRLLKSRYFVSKFIQKYDLAVPLFAAKAWQQENDFLVIDPKIYDESRKVWVRKVSAPYKAEPSAEELFDKFTSIFTVVDDANNGTVGLVIEFLSPTLAKKWLDLITQEINDEIRNRDLSDAKGSIAYLESQIELTNIAELKTLFFSLIEEKVKVVMLANIKEQYVLETIDPAIVPESKIKPQRAVIVISVFFISFLLSVTFFLCRNFFQKNR